MMQGFVASFSDASPSGTTQESTVGGPTQAAIDSWVAVKIESLVTSRALVASPMIALLRAPMDKDLWRRLRKRGVLTRDSRFARFLERVARRPGAAGSTRPPSPVPSAGAGDKFH